MEASSRKAPRRWTPDEQEAAQQMRAAGWSVSKIAAALGRCRKLVDLHLVPGAADRDRESGRRYREENKGKDQERKRIYYVANRERVLEKGRRYRDENREKVLARHRLYREQNIKAVLARGRAYYAKHRERCGAASRQYYWENREKALAAARTWRMENIERCKENARRWQSQNRERCRDCGRRRNALKRASRRRALVPLNRQRLLQRYALFGNRCVYCGDAGKMTADHVLALTKGGLDEPSNIVPACISCNCSKKNSPVESWYRRQPFFSEARWRKVQRHCQGIAQGQMSLALPPPDGAGSITTGRLPATAIAGT